MESMKIRVTTAALRQEGAFFLFETPLRELSASRLAAVGHAVGSELSGGVVLVCSDRRGTPLRGALVAGLCESGCLVRDGGEAFLAQAAYLTSTLPARAGVYLGEDGLRLLNENGTEQSAAFWRGVETRLRTARMNRREFFEWHAPRNVAALRALYPEALISATAGIRPFMLDLRGERSAVSCLREVLSLTGCGAGEELRLRLSDGGRQLAVFSDKTGYLDAERITALMTAADGQTVTRPDGLMLALRLLRHLSETGETLSQLDARLPSQVTVHHTVTATSRTEEAIGQLAGEALDAHGVRLAVPEGTVTVRQTARGHLLSVLACAETCEVAEELCAAVTAQLHTIPLDK